MKNNNDDSTSSSVDDLTPTDHLSHLAPKISDPNTEMRNIPVLLINFNRPALTRGLIDNLRLIKPTRIYYSVDGPRTDNLTDAKNCEEVARILEEIDWECNVYTKISSVNLGLRSNVKSSIDWFFSENKMGIILEDDIRFSDDFFKYCHQMLNTYEYDSRVGVISGNNMISHLPQSPHIEDEYFLCKIFHCWGWATWATKWKIYDDNIDRDDNFFEEKFPTVYTNDLVQKFWLNVRESLRTGRVNSWAWRMQFSLWRNDLKCITPRRNLSINVGFDEDATHTGIKPLWLDGWNIDKFNQVQKSPSDLNSYDNFEKCENEIILGVTMTKSLDLGCGRNPKNICNADTLYGIDVRDDVDKNIKKADLVIEKIPFPDNFFEYVTAHDFLEHIPRLIYAPTRRYPFIELMNEIYRVLKPGGTFVSFTPAYPHAEVFRDPTHVNIISEETFSVYFDDVNRWAKMYGFDGAFKITSQEWRGPHLLTLMQKVAVPEGGIDL